MRVYIAARKHTSWFNCLWAQRITFSGLTENMSLKKYHVCILYRNVHALNKHVPFLGVRGGTDVGSPLLCARWELSSLEPETEWSNVCACVCVKQWRCIQCFQGTGLKKALMCLAVTTVWLQVLQPGPEKRQRKKKRKKEVRGEMKVNEVNAFYLLNKTWRGNLLWNFLHLIIKENVLFNL